MKRLFLASVLGLSLVALQSCKKEATLTAAEEITTETPANEPAEGAKPVGPLTSIALSENHHNFGDVKKGESVQHIYEVTNTGDQPLVISQVKPACGCTAPEFTKDPILPGQKGQITLKFDSSNFEGLQQKQAEVFANVETQPIVLSFSANVVK